MSNRHRATRVRSKPGSPKCGDSTNPGSAQEEHKSTWAKLTTKCVYEAPWVRAEEDRVLGRDGTPTVYRVVQIKPGGMIAALTDTGELFLIGQYRHAINRFSWEVIGGAVDEGEAPLKAAKRELREEAGLSADRWTCLGSADLGTAVLRSKVWFYIAEDLTQGKAQPDHSEWLTVKKVPLAKAVDMVWTGQITHLPSVALILKAREVVSGDRSLPATVN